MRALLIVDLQADYLRGLPGAARLVDRVARHRARAHAAGDRVIHVWTDGPMPHRRADPRCVPGSPGHASPLPVLPGEQVLRKRFFSAFDGDALDRALVGIRRLRLAGVHSHACIRATALDAWARGFEVEIPEDAVGSDDPVQAAGARRWMEARILVPEPPPTAVHRCPRDLAPAFEPAWTSPAEVAAAMADLAPLPEPERVLEAFAAALEAETGALAERVALDVGKPVALARAEVGRAAASIRACLRHRRGDEGLDRRRPLGRVALVTPWNNPVLLPVAKLAPALLHGNSVAWKPAPAGSRIAEALWRLYAACGGRPESLRLLPGDARTARACFEHADAVSLTGGPEAGAAAAEACARRGLPLQAELGGNNATVVWAPADPEAAARAVAWGAFAFAGQRCTATRRLVLGPGAEPFLAALREASAGLPQGDPLAEETVVGPVIDPERAEELEAILRRGGGGWRAPGAAGPAQVAPAIVEAAPDSELVQEESFGPILVLQRAQDFEEALALAEGVPQGLVASLFTADDRLWAHFRDRVQVGVVKRDAATAEVAVDRPFGGWKASGVGPPEHGEADLAFYTRVQAVYPRG